MKSHIIGFLLVTLAQIPMPIKIGTTFQNKLRPNVKRAREQECTKKDVKKIKWPPRIVHCIQIEYKYKLAKNQGVFIVPRGNLTFAF